MNNVNVFSHSQCAYTLVLQNMQTIFRVLSYVHRESGYLAGGIFTHFLTQHIHFAQFRVHFSPFLPSFVSFLGALLLLGFLLFGISLARCIRTFHHHHRRRCWRPWYHSLSKMLCLFSLSFILSLCLVCSHKSISNSTNCFSFDKSVCVCVCVFGSSSFYSPFLLKAYAQVRVSTHWLACTNTHTDAGTRAETHTLAHS